MRQERPGDFCLISMAKEHFMKFDNMVLYVKPGCPFCHRVLDFMAANGIQILSLIHISEPTRRS